MSKLALTGFSISSLLIASTGLLQAQTSLKPKYANSSVYTGIEVGSKGVKMSIVEIGKDVRTHGAFQVLKDTSVNTDFISFNQTTFTATLNGLYSLYNTALNNYQMPSENIYTVVSSGIKSQAEKEEKTAWVNRLIDSFRLITNEPKRQVEVVSVLDEARLSHLGIVPDSRRYSTFLIDIGSGNTKGGYFPLGNTKDFKLFQLNWGTKSTANATEKRLEDDNSLENYSKQLNKVLIVAENSEIIYAVNASGGYPLSDNIAFSGGIAWAVATLIQPDMIDNPVVPVSFNDVVKFSEKLYKNHASLLDEQLLMNLSENANTKTLFAKEIKRVHSVFDQRSLMAGTGLLLKIMRQYASIYESKEFFLVKNGQVGWISAYVDKSVKQN